MRTHDAVMTSISGASHTTEIGLVHCVPVYTPAFAGTKLYCLVLSFPIAT